MASGSVEGKNYVTFPDGAKDIRVLWAWDTAKAGDRFVKTLI